MRFIDNVPFDKVEYVLRLGVTSNRNFHAMTAKLLFSGWISRVIETLYIPHFDLPQHKQSSFLRFQGLSFD